ncbi:MAG: thiamine pyrophosphate-dependent enzyme, partial [Pseudomonadota bacterium]
RDQRDREAFQEVDYRAMYGPLAKWVAEIEQTERIPEYVSHAFHVAQSGRPGPVVLALPEDMLSASAEVADAPVALPARQGMSADATASVTQSLAAARRPLVIVGGGGWSAEASRDLQTFVERHDLPVAASFRCQDYVDNRHPNYVGDVGIGINPALAERVRTADVLLVIGARLGEMTTSGYTLLTPPVPQQALIHIHADPNEIGRVFRPALGIGATSREAVAALAALPAMQSPPWSDSVRQGRAAYDAWQGPQETPGAVKMEAVIRHLSETLPENAIVTNGAGNYSAWLHRYYRYKGWKTQLAPTSGSMGYGLPAAVAAKLAHPEREVLCLAGDGCFQMHMQEFGTAAQYGANIIVLISNNGQYGTIRMHQERAYPGRVSGTAMRNPDFAALARSYGGYGATITEQGEFAGALAEARAAGVPAILDLQTDPAALSPKLTLASA